MEDDPAAADGSATFLSALKAVDHAGGADRYSLQAKEMSEPRPDPESVTDEESFLAFVRALAADRSLAAEEEKQDAGFSAPRGWQSSTIEQFLEGAVAWAEASGFGRRQGLGDEVSPWRRFAVFLYTGKIYE